MDQLIALKNSNKSLIIASHNLRQVASICDNLMIIKNGKILEINDKITILKKYKESSPIELNVTPNTNKNKDAITITNTVVKNQNNQACNSFVRDDTITIEIEFKNYFKKELEIAVFLNDLFNNNLFGTATFEKQLSEKISIGPNSLHWEFHPSILSIGRYYINLFVFSKSDFSIISKFNQVTWFDIKGKSLQYKSKKEILNYELPIKIDTELKLNE